MPAAELADPPAHVARPREPDLVDRALGERALEAGERLRAVGEHHLEHPGGDPAAEHELREGVGHGRRVLGRLPHHGVAAQQRRDEVPGRDRHGKFPAVTIAAVPTGTRNVNSCLSGISLGTVWP